MTELTTAELISIIVSVTAMLVSVLFGVISYRTSSRQNALQAQIVALETGRERDRLAQARSAQMSASIQRLGRGDYRLCITNQTGSVTARNVRTFLDGQPMLEHDLVLRGQDEITLFAPGVDARYLLGVAQQSQAVVNVRIEWEDESGPDRVWESQLKVL